MKKKLPLIVVFVLALLLRIAFIPNPGFEADVAFWKGWGLAAADKGVVWSMLNTNNNYPTPFAYTLGAMTDFYRVLGGDPHNFNEYWNNTNVKFLIAAKLPAILADFGIAIIFLWIGKKFHDLFQPFGTEPEKKNKSFLSRIRESHIHIPIIGNVPIFFFLLSALYLLNPVSVMDGAWWGQVDSLGVIVFLFAFLSLLYKKPFLAGFIFMAAMMTKLQNMIYGPLFFVFVWQEFGFDGLLQAIAGAVTGFFGLNIEFLLSKNMSRVIGSLVDNYDYFPYMSLHAYNIWWIVSGGHGMQMSDKFLSIGVMTAKSVGTVLFSSTYLLAVLQMSLPTLLLIIQPWRKKKMPMTSSMSGESIFHFFLGLSLINAGFFLLQTQSHERYAFPLIVFLLFLVPFLKRKKQILFLLSYGLLSILYFYNLHTAFAVNYPDDVFSILKGFWITPLPTMVVASIFLASFAGFIVFFRKELKAIPLLITGALIVLMIFAENASYMIGQPILVSKLSPVSWTQGYGQRSTDMPVNAVIGNPKSWNWLSDQYAFYHHGIGTHAVSQIRYDIGKHFSQFRTDYGIDTEAGTAASATFEVWGDDRILFTSPKMGRYDLPKFVQLDITGVKMLTLITRDGGDGNQDDHTDWLNTKLYK